VLYAYVVADVNLVFCSFHLSDYVGHLTMDELDPGEHLHTIMAVSLWVARVRE